ncbi:energy transducer TonB [bacterium]|nr:energy transducer TonB [bacterium]
MTATGQLGLGRSILASIFGHAVLIGAGLVGWRFASEAIPASLGQEVAFDVEVAAGQFHKPSPVVFQQSPKIASPIDEPDAAEQQQKEVIASSGNLEQQGQGGEAASTQGAAGGVWDVYRSVLRSRIHEALQYPRVSKNLGETGRVQVRFSVLKDGTIQDVSVIGPSAFERLNSAAVETVKRVARLDPLPAGFDADRWNTFIPIEFALK